MFLMGAMVVNADNMFDKEIYCSIEKEKEHIMRTPPKVYLHAYQGEETIVVSSELTTAQYIRVIIKNEHAEEQKSELLVVAAGQNATLYIGDLPRGSYTLVMKTESYTLCGSFEIE